MRKLILTIIILTISFLFSFNKSSDSFETSDLPDLVVTSVSNPPASIKGDKKFTVKDTTMNQGLKKARKSVTRYYLSVDAIKDDNDILLKGRRRVKALKPGKSSGGETKVTVPSGTFPGNYYLIACADDKNKITESDETNNCMSSAATTQIIVGIISPSQICGRPNFGVEYPVSDECGFNIVRGDLDGGPYVCAAVAYPEDNVILVNGVDSEAYNWRNFSYTFSFNLVLKLQAIDGRALKVLCGVQSYYPQLVKNITGSFSLSFSQDPWASNCNITNDSINKGELNIGKGIKSAVSVRDCNTNELVQLILDFDGSLYPTDSGGTLKFRSAGGDDIFIFSKPGYFIY